MKSAKQMEMDQLQTTLHTVEHRVHALKERIAGDPGLELDEAVSKLMSERPLEFKAYSIAMQHVLESDEELASRYTASFGKLSPVQARTFGISPDPDDEDTSSVAAGKQLDVLTQAWLREHPLETDYRVALDIILAAHPDLAMLWSKSFNSAKKQTFKEGDGDAGAEIDRLASKLQSEHPDWSYEKCLGQILDQHPELKKKYAANR